MNATFSVIVWLLPIVFMLHDFEEIIFMRSWLESNGNYVHRRFPKIAWHLEGLSTEGFSIAVAEEFIGLSGITIAAVLCNWYLLWLAVFGGFTLHLLVHLVQGMVLRGYVPGLLTTLGALVYCGWGMATIISNQIFTPTQVITWSVLGMAMVAINLFLAFMLARLFDKRYSK